MKTTEQSPWTSTTDHMKFVRPSQLVSLTVPLF